MARHKVAKCRPGYCIRLSALMQTVPLIATSGPNLARSSTVWEEGQGDGKAKDVGGMAASNYYRERGSSSNEGGPAAWHDLGPPRVSLAVIAHRAVAL